MAEYVNQATGEVHAMEDVAGLAGAVLAEQGSAARQAMRLDRALAEVEDLRQQIADLAAAADERDSEPAHRTPWNWRSLTPAGAEGLWHELAGWVAWLRHRYPLAQAVPPCWWRHNEVVEELTALHLAWRAAYADTGARLTSPADFHTHYLPAVIDHIASWGVHCTDVHKDRAAGVYAPSPSELPADLSARIQADVDARRAGGSELSTGSLDSRALPLQPGPTDSRQKGPRDA